MLHYELNIIRRQTVERLNKQKNRLHDTTKGVMMAWCAICLNLHVIFSGERILRIVQIFVDCLRSTVKNQFNNIIVVGDFVFWRLIFVGKVPALKMFSQINLFESLEADIGLCN